MMSRKIVCAISSLLLFSSLADAEDWPQFRGHNATGVSTESRNLPVEFSYENGVLWKQEIGQGIACPIVSNGKLITTSIKEKNTFEIQCFNAANGSVKWTKSFDVGDLPPITAPNVPASSTPAADGERVYVYFDTLGLMAFELEDGNQLWTKKIQQPFYLLGWGAAHSPIIYNDLVIFNQDDDLAPFVVAFDKVTGEQRWRTERPEMLAGYAVPVICKANGREDLVIAGSGKMKGYDPKTGKELWQCNTLLRTIMTTPIVDGENIYMTCQSYGDTDRVLKFALLQWKDTDQDGRLDKKEIDEPFWEKFDKGDADKDGYLVDDEIDNAFQAETNRVGGGDITQMIKGGGLGDVTDSHLVWNVDEKTPSNIASALVYDDQLFMVKKGGICASYDKKSGKNIFMKRRLNNFGNYYASPVAGDGKVYVQGENGFLLVVKLGEEPEVLAKNDMGDSVVATPAIADGRIFVRTLNTIYCFSKEASE
jgi:outer membrane protein assembly factor BamB